MRDDVGEVKVHHSSRELQHSPRLHGSRAGDRRTSAILAPVAVDEAFSDELTAYVAEEPASRRQMGDGATSSASSRVVDRPHEKAEQSDAQASDNVDILRELADRLAELQQQQMQIQQLLVSAERS